MSTVMVSFATQKRNFFMRHHRRNDINRRPLSRIHTEDTSYEDSSLQKKRRNELEKALPNSGDHGNHAPSRDVTPLMNLGAPTRFSE